MRLQMGTHLRLQNEKMYTERGSPSSHLAHRRDRRGQQEHDNVGEVFAIIRIGEIFKQEIYFAN
jgi:hypothetical protein